MTGKRWDPSSVTTQLRLTSLRLGQLQERQDSKGAITRKDIATLLQKRNVSFARTKARSLQRENALGDLLEVLEMFVGQLLEHFHELDQSTHLSSNVIEAASTIIYAAPHVGLKDLEIISHLLAQHLGPDFTRSAVTNKDGRVAAIAVRAITLPPPVKELDVVLQRIASEYGITWTPEPLRQDTLKLVSELLDPQAAPVLDLRYLRHLCRRGIPDEPRWLRPRIWRLLLGVLPAVKASWTKETESQRNSYYDLVQRLLDPLSGLSTQDSASNTLDAMLLNLLKQLSTTPSNLFGDLVQAPGSFSSCPLDDDARDEIKLKSANNLNLRLDILRATNTERISLLSDKASSMVFTAPEISLSSPNITRGERLDTFTTTLLSFEPFATNTVHPKHFSALLRLLFVHSSINPGNISPRIASLLVPLYAVLNHEVIPDDLAHVEADTFWLFEAMMGEFSELENTEGGSAWMKRLSDRLAWADFDLFNGLRAIGLDPALPHYSYQWLAPLLTHTLPLFSVLPIWDAIFSCPPRTRDVNPKVDHLVNVCTAMLIRTRGIVSRLGRNGCKPPSLWSEEQTLYAPLSPLHPWELEEDFMEGLAILQRYPIDAAGGIDMILTDAFDLALRRDGETELSRKENSSLGARIKATMWKGFTNRELSPDTSPEESEDELVDEKSHEENNNTELSNNAASSLASTLATTIWRGITNQTSMEPPPSPNSPLSPSTSFSTPVINATEPDGQDSLHPIAKVSSNWRTKSILGSWGRSLPLNAQESSLFSQIGARKEANGSHSMGSNGSGRTLSFIRRKEVHSSPSRLHHLRTPRDSFISPHNKIPSTKEGGNIDGFIDRTYQSPSSFAALTRTSISQAATRSVPRPLLLSPSTLLTSPIRPVSQSTGGFPAPDNCQWVNVVRRKGHNLHRDSMSSVSSLSPSDAIWSTQSSRNGWDSDTGTSSRRVPLNRKLVSPMSPSFRRQRCSESPTASSGRGLTSSLLSDQIDSKSWEPSGILNSPILQEPHKNEIQMKDPGFYAANQIMMPKKLIRQVVPSTNDPPDLSTAETPSWSSCLRTKPYTPRPFDLDLLRGSMERKLSDSNRLTVEWTLNDHEVPITLGASTFEADDSHSFTTPKSSKSSRRLRKTSTETQERPRNTPADYHESRTRKASTGQWPQKSSNDQKDITRRRESSAEEGDDEGYDDLLSAYESESSQIIFLR
ncbi:TBC domain-containing protein [Termitomyces sp. T112]|nr:TBC domain-containing protein [Termitomyces sp. T112]